MIEGISRESREHTHSKQSVSSARPTWPPYPIGAQPYSGPTVTRWFIDPKHRQRLVIVMLAPCPVGNVLASPAQHSPGTRTAPEHASFVCHPDRAHRTRLAPTRSPTSPRHSPPPLTAPPTSIHRHTPGLSFRQYSLKTTDLSLHSVKNLWRFRVESTSNCAESSSGEL